MQTGAETLKEATHPNGSDGSDSVRLVKEVKLDREHVDLSEGDEMHSSPSAGTKIPPAEEPLPPIASTAPIDHSASTSAAESSEPFESEPLPSGESTDTGIAPEEGEAEEVSLHPNLTSHGLTTGSRHAASFESALISDWQILTLRLLVLFT